MTPAETRESILDLARARGEVTTQIVVDTYGITNKSARKDLQKLTKAFQLAVVQHKFFRRQI